MDYFNKKKIKAFETGKYYCDCGALMEFEDEWEDILICPKCGKSIDVQQYGFKNDEEFESLFPTEEELDE